MGQKVLGAILWFLFSVNPRAIRKQKYSSGSYDQGPCASQSCFRMVGLYRNQNPCQYKKKVLSFSPVIKKFTVANSAGFPYNSPMKIEKDKKMSLLNDNVFFAAVYVAGMAMGIAVCQLVQYFA